MKIFLVGLSGSGKTTLGQRLAEVLQIPFVDMDWEIEKREGKSVKQIFSDHGEDHFRQIESQVLREWAGVASDFVMGTGGGAPCFYKGMEIINNSGISVFLDVPIETILRRLASATDRPLLNGNKEFEKEAKLRSLLKERLPIYNRAHFILQDPTLDRLVQALKLKR